MDDVRSVESDLAGYYDQEADDRAQRALPLERVRAREGFLSLFPRPPKRLLEIGTGVGRDAGFFAAQGINVFGVDISRAQAAHARTTGAHMAIGSARQLPFADRTFDALWTMSALMHIPNSGIEDALGDIRRVLAPEAVAGIGVWGGPDIEHRSNQDRYHPPRLFSRRSDGKWRSLLGAVGTVEQFEAWDPLPGDDDFHYQWAVVRRA